LPGSSRGQLRGTRILVALAAYDAALQLPGASESPDWLEEVRARLAPRVPLGQRLHVIAPRYVDIRITVRLVAARNANPQDVQRRTEGTLRDKFALVAPPVGEDPWPFGRDIAPLSVKGWLRNVEDVARVLEVRLFAGGADVVGKPVTVGAIRLPRLRLEPGDVAVGRRPGRGGT